LPTFLIEFDSEQAAFAYLSSATALNCTFEKIVLINPAAQEYLHAAQPARDPDVMPAVPAAAVTLRPWKLVLRLSRNELGVKAQELGLSVEKELRTALKNFRRAVLERHRNAMIIRFKVPQDKTEQLLPAAARIASDYNFINPAIAENDGVTLAFVPLSVDPPAAMHYAKVIQQLSSEFGGGFKVMACPREVTPDLARPNRSKISLLVQAISKILRRGGR
jgi:hypothetical protein